MADNVLRFCLCVPVVDVCDMHVLYAWYYDELYLFIGPDQTSSLNFLRA